MGRALEALLVLACVFEVQSTVLVTGAAGRTGSLLYHALKKDGRLGQVRALVKNVTKARERLQCNACDASEGIYIGDVTDPKSLPPAFDGTDALAIAVGVYGTEPKEVVKEVEWLGVKNQLQALLKIGAKGKRVALISTMGTTKPPADNSSDVMFYKLNAEAFIESSGVPYSIIKPCGLNEEAAGNRLLMVGHDDSESWFSQGFYMIPRADVAAVAAASLAEPVSDALRFDLCAKGPGSGPPMPAKQLLEAALMPWQRRPALEKVFA
eukprot:TRINITY_DN76980_c0_g1_i1.p1 TRINITY_DN76980_c0_g1~~TRINITY_DN76980_c0_g1_i1.p1  ORF type:complete len:267 (-),score=47.76 TRINITY_DN76980_c0_g1_i1:69-869(-)